MPRAGFEPTTPVFERAKTGHALDRPATVSGCAVKIYYTETNVLLIELNSLITGKKIA
jgi:hypothetical protein